MRQQLVPRFPESNTLTLDRLFVTRSPLYGDLLCMIPFCLPLLVFPLLRNVANRNKALLVPTIPPSYHMIPPLKSFRYKLRFQ